MHLEIEIDDNTHKVEFVNVREMNLGELSTLKEVSKMPPAHVEQLRWAADPDAWRGLIYIAARRAGLEIEASDLDGINLHDTITPLLTELAEKRKAMELEAAKEAAADGPPAEAASAAAAEANPETENGSPES